MNGESSVVLDGGSAMPGVNRAMSSVARQRRGQTNHCSGAAAEEQVERSYLRTGHHLRNRRWRGGVGEIDLVMEKAGEIVFVEVKASRTHAEAAQALRGGQITRLLRSAEAYIGQLPRGLMTPMRFDVALVDRMGRVDVIENALGA
jgi:putative endonuclease